MMGTRSEELDVLRKRLERTNAEFGAYAFFGTAFGLAALVRLYRSEFAWDLVLSLLICAGSFVKVGKIRVERNNLIDEIATREKHAERTHKYSTGRPHQHKAPDR